MPYSTFIEVFEALGDAIRAKESSSLPIPLYEMPDRIKALGREFDLDGYSGNAWLAKAARLVDTTGMTDMSGMFARCTATSIDLSGWNTSSVTKMTSMFGGCTATTLNIANLDTSSVTNMGALFGSCRVTKLDLSGWDTSSATDMSGMFNIIGSPKIWLPSTFVATSVVEPLRKPFENAPSLTAADVYTDATDAETQGWGTINSKFTMHYNSTYQDFLDA